MLDSKQALQLCILYDLLDIYAIFVAETWGEFCTGGEVSINVTENMYLPSGKPTEISFNSGFSCTITLTPPQGTVLYTTFTGSGYGNDSITAMVRSDQSTQLKILEVEFGFKLVPVAQPLAISIRMASSGMLYIQAIVVPVNFNENQLFLPVNESYIIDTKELKNAYSSVTFIAPDSFQIVLFIVYWHAFPVPDSRRLIVFDTLAKRFLITGAKIVETKKGVLATSRQYVTIFYAGDYFVDASVMAFACRDMYPYDWGAYSAKAWENDTFTIEGSAQLVGSTTMIRRSPNDNTIGMANYTLKGNGAVFSLFSKIPLISTGTLDGSLLFRDRTMIDCPKDEALQQRRKEQFQENTNRRVLVEWVRITGLRNPQRWKYDRLLEHLAKVITKYQGDNKPMPFTWPAPAGEYNGMTAYRAKVSYEYWRFFMSEGRKRLMEYNKENGCRIEINKEQTLKISDETNLGLFLRKKLNEAYRCANKKAPDMSVKKGRLNIGKELSLKPAVAAIRLGIDLSGWNKTPVKELLTEQELKDYESGVLSPGSLKLPGIDLGNNNANGTRSNEDAVETGDSGQQNSIRKRLHESTEEITEPSTKLTRSE
ncbi:hypothetical protein Y032_0200g1709 [Ancylostoma ceylanicum]|uniref:Uncharacterized protein n=1 Tax=Ancylostoma ceylanicum TaxID=53326 RepID=A0A016SMN8_9BILA|nr:hypothetical protein Y032_0200g1709 [Ancylostoma ceylanicum]